MQWWAKVDYMQKLLINTLHPDKSGPLELHYCVKLMLPLIQLAVANMKWLKAAHELHITDGNAGYWEQYGETKYEKISDTEEAWNTWSHTEGPDCSGWDMYTMGSNIIPKQALTQFSEMETESVEDSQSDIRSEDLQNIDTTSDRSQMVTLYWLPFSLFIQKSFRWFR